MTLFHEPAISKMVDGIKNEGNDDSCEPRERTNNQKLFTSALLCLISKQNCHVIQVRWLSGVPRSPLHQMTCNCSHTPFSSVKIKLCLLLVKCGSLAQPCVSSLSLFFISCIHLVMLPFCWVCAPLWPRHTLAKTNTPKNSNTNPSKSSACKYRVLSTVVSKSKQM